jgi:hypothetical protein
MTIKVRCGGKVGGMPQNLDDSMRDEAKDSVEHRRGKCDLVLQFLVDIVGISR